MEDTVKTGRPTTQLTVNGVRLTAFIDTGSEITLIKKEVLSTLPSCKTRSSSRTLRGVAGKIIEVCEEVDLKFTIGNQVKCRHRVSCVSAVSFPGDILIGVDWLRRFNYEIVHSNYPKKSYLTLQGIRLPVTYTDEPSLEVGLVSEVSNVASVPSGIATNLHACRSFTCSPRSGMFVTVKVPQGHTSNIALISGVHSDVLVPHSITSVKDRYLKVWVVNPDARPRTIKGGTRIAVCYEVEETEPEEEALPTGEPVADIQPTHGTKQVCMTADVVPELDDLFAHLQPDQQSQMRELVARFPDLFSGDKSDIGKVPNITHRIVTTTEKPICTRQWRLPHHTKQVIRDECDRMLAAGVIEPSTSPWLSPVVLVRKPDGTIRFCVDFRPLNHVTVADSYPLPRIDELLDELGGTAYFSLLDARSAYWSVEVEPADRPKTAFMDGHKLYQFRRLPFGLATAPTTFQRTMNMILGSVLGKHTIAYLDDVVVYSQSFEDHMRNLCETLTLLSEAGLKLNLSKCELVKSSIKFLGFRVSGEGIAPDPDKIKSLSEMPAPKNVKEIRRFLGGAGFFRKHIPNFATIASPLTILTRKDSTFKWGREQEESFTQLKEALMSAPVLRLPDYEQPFEIHTDASKVALGAALMQRDEEGKAYAVAYYSRKFRAAESNYPPIDQEALAVVEGVRVFDPYVYGRKFKIYTDHRPLTYIFSRKTKSPRMSRFSHELSFYNYQLIYNKGAQHYVPDLLSRAVATVNLGDTEPASIRAAQQDDPLWKDVISYLEEEQFPRTKIPLPIGEFELQRGVLYHIRQLPDRVIHQLVVPKALRQQALQMAHCPPLAAHPGTYRTYVNLRNMFYFPNMLKHVKAYVQTCLQCQRRKGPMTRRATMHSMPHAHLPLEHVSADLIDLGGSSTGHRYVLSLIDLHSRFLQLIPLRRKDAESVTTAFMNHYVTLFGPPRTLQTDQGSEFINNLFREVCHMVQTRTTYTTAYHPQANGAIERSNRVVKDALASLVATRPSRWPDYLPQVRLAVNTALHRTTGEQPLYLMTGRHGHFPVGLTNEMTHDTAGTYAEHLRQARKVAVEASEKARQGWAQNYNSKVRKQFNPTEGTLVLRRNYDRLSMGKSGLRDRWIGPCRVVKRVGPVVFMVMELQHPYRTVRCHVNQLKEFYPNHELQFTEPNECADPQPLVQQDLQADLDADQEEVDDPEAPPDSWAAALLAAVRPHDS